MACELCVHSDMHTTVWFALIIHPSVVWLLSWYDQWFVTQFNAPTGGISSLSFVRLATNCISSGTMLHNILHSHCGMVVPESTNWKPIAGCLLRALDCSMTAPHYHVRWSFCLGSWRIQLYYSWRLVYVKYPAAFFFFIALFLTYPISKASVVGLQVMGDMRHESANCKVKEVLTQHFWMLFVRR